MIDFPSWAPAAAIAYFNEATAVSESPEAERLATLRSRCPHVQMWQRLLTDPRMERVFAELDRMAKATFGPQHPHYLGWPRAFMHSALSAWKCHETLVEHADNFRHAPDKIDRLVHLIEQLIEAYNETPLGNGITAHFPGIGDLGEVDYSDVLQALLEDAKAQREVMAGWWLEHREAADALRPARGFPSSAVGFVGPFYDEFMAPTTGADPDDRDGTRKPHRRLMAIIASVALDQDISESSIRTALARRDRRLG